MNVGVYNKLRRVKQMYLWAVGDRGGLGRVGVGVVGVDSALLTATYAPCILTTYHSLHFGETSLT